MGWTGEEEQLQKQAEAAWGAPADEDILDLAAELIEPPADIAVEGPPPAFPWHIPVGAPVPDPVAGPPLVNGFHHGPPFLNGFHGNEDDLEDDLV
jgi:hypothetical protein